MEEYKMKKAYETPEFDIVLIDEEDVITTSFEREEDEGEIDKTSFWLTYCFKTRQDSLSGFCFIENHTAKQ